MKKYILLPLAVCLFAFYSSASAMVLKTNIWGLRSNPELLTFLQLYGTLGVAAKTTKGVQAVELDFGLQDHESLLNADELAMLFAVDGNIWISGASVYSTAVGDWKMDQDVPEDFPNSTITEEIDGADVTRQRTWREYSQHFPVLDDNYLIHFTTRRDDNNNASLPSDSLLRLYLREFLTYKTKAAAKIKMDEYSASLVVE